MEPTIVLVHGAFAESSSWNDVIPLLMRAGHRVTAWAVPLRGVVRDAAALTDLARSIDGPIVLVGHSYGGALLTNVPADAGDVQALVFVAGYALNPGESCGDASSLAPGGTLGPTLLRVPLSDGGVDTYIEPAKYHHQFADDLPEDQTTEMAVTQRPVTEAALFEPSGDTPLWRTVPSWFLFGELDRNIWPARTESWPSGPDPAGPSRSPAPRTSSACPTPRNGADHPGGGQRGCAGERLTERSAAGRHSGERGTPGIRPGNHPGATRVRRTSGSETAAPAVR